MDKKYNSLFHYLLAHRHSVYIFVCMTTTNIFNNGNSQAVRIPKKFRLKTKKAFIRKDGDSLVLTPINDYWMPLKEACGSVTDDFMLERNQPENEERDLSF